MPIFVKKGDILECERKYITGTWTKNSGKNIRVVKMDSKQFCLMPGKSTVDPVALSGNWLRKG